MAWVVLLIASAVTAAVGILLLVDWRWLRHLPALRVAPAATDSAPPQRVSIIIPARNEEASIARCLDGALRQTASNASNIEVIVVDDGSTDATPHILGEYAARYPQMRVVQGRPLPPGWIGKCNACQHGSEFAAGQWLLFLDADTEAGPNLVANMLTTTRQHQLDVLSVFPLNHLGSISERLILPIFWRLAFTVFPAIKHWNPIMPARSALAVGQCLMFRAEAYRAVGGHAAVRNKVLEDVEFAQVMRRAGYRLAVVAGLDDIAVRMYQNFAQVRQGLAKHAHAGQRLSGWRAYWGMFSNALLSVVPVCALALVLIGTQWGWLDTLSNMALVVSGLGYALSLAYWLRWYRHLFRLSASLSLGLALLTPLSVLAHMSITGLGVLRVASKRGVMWKGRAVEG